MSWNISSDNFYSCESHEPHTKCQESRAIFKFSLCNLIIVSNQILFRNNNKNTLYMYMSIQNKKVLLRGVFFHIGPYHRKNSLDHYLYYIAFHGTVFEKY